MQRRPGELRELLARPDQKTSRQDFYFHALTDPKGDRFVVVSWAFAGDDTASGQRWLTAKGYFEGLTAKIDALEMTGGSADGVRVGTVTVNFVDCNSAEFHFAPDDDSLESQNKITRVDSGIWKYCK